MNEFMGFGDAFGLRAPAEALIVATKTVERALNTQLRNSRLKIIMTALEMIEYYYQSFSNLRIKNHEEIGRESGSKEQFPFGRVPGQPFECI